jgi:hypothetical protein
MSDDDDAVPAMINPGEYNVSSLAVARALKSHDNRQWTPIDCLADAILDIKSGKTPCDKLIVVRINTNEDKFDVGYHCANMKASEMIAALEILKAFILDEMGY